MRSPLLILSLLAINCWTVMGEKRGAHGTEGGSLEIRCPYPDDYIHVRKYFCRDPCGNKDVLIKSETRDTVIRSGRFSIIDNPNGRSFTVTITSLTLQDAGLYYCGIDRWFKDKLEKVEVTVSKVPVATSSSSAPVPAQTVTDSPSHTHAVWTSDRVSTEQEMPRGNFKSGRDDLSTNGPRKSMEVITRQRSPLLESDAAENPSVALASMSHPPAGGVESSPFCPSALNETQSPDGQI